VLRWGLRGSGDYLSYSPPSSLARALLPVVALGLCERFGHVFVKVHEKTIYVMLCRSGSTVRRSAVFERDAAPSFGRHMKLAELRVADIQKTRKGNFAHPSPKQCPTVGVLARPLE